MVQSLQRDEIRDSRSYSGTYALGERLQFEHQVWKVFII